MNASKGQDGRANRKLVCQNERFNVFFERVLAQDGSEIPDYLVVEPKTVAEGGVTGVAVLPMVNGEFALLHIHRLATNETRWEAPRGFVEVEETHARSALRELEEETGLACKETDLCDLGLITPEAGIVAAKIHLFAAMNCKPLRDFHANEIGHRRMKSFTPVEMAAMAESEIQDPSTLTAYYRLTALQTVESRKELRT